MKTLKTLLLSAFLLSLIPASAARAWIITQVEPDPKAGLSRAIVVPYATEPRTDVFEIDKFFMRDPNDATIPMPLILSFTREEGDQDLITIVNELIYNMQVSQAHVWDDFHVALITPLGNVTFINPDGARAYQQIGGAPRLGLTPISATATQIDWYDADQPVPYGTLAQAPYNQLELLGLAINASQLEVGDTFELKEWPTIPEPVTLATLALGAAGILLRRRKK